MSDLKKIFLYLSHTIWSFHLVCPLLRKSQKKGFCVQRAVNTHGKNGGIGRKLEAKDMELIVLHITTHHTSYNSFSSNRKNTGEGVWKKSERAHFSLNVDVANQFCVAICYERHPKKAQQQSKLSFFPREMYMLELESRTHMLTLQWFATKLDQPDKRLNTPHFLC